MSSEIRVKICGLTDPAGVSAAVSAGAAYVGFVHFPRSPRHLGIGAIRDLAVDVSAGVAKVVLLVNPDDDLLRALTDTVPVDMIQLHGSEPPERVADIRTAFRLPVMKAVGIAGAGDLGQIDRYAQVADQILLDAKPPRGADRPGGNAVSFDWTLIAGRRWTVPWMLAGGLTARTLCHALAVSGARQVDVSSAVETAPGVKDPGLIADFVRAAHACG